MISGCPGGRRRRRLPGPLPALIAALAAAAAPVPRPAAATETAVLTLTITDVASAEGMVYVALYDDPAGFLDESRMRFRARADAAEGRVTVRVEDLPPGRYAVAMYHDENGNGEFDTGLFGIPLEGFGFTRDAPVMPALPTFDDAAIPVDAPDTRATLKMRYAF
jgi:uncharacterized protein (DUF2141 family)